MSAYTGKFDTRIGLLNLYGVRVTMRKYFVFSVSLVLCSQLMACSAFESITESHSKDETTITNNQPPKKIAILLPLQGKFSDSGQAIRNGFMTAYEAQKNQQSEVPAIMVLDTSGQNIKAIYQQAIAEGADIVVGPLEKEQVQTLIKSTSLKVPTLALNAVTPDKVPQLIQFALSQSDEAEQVATHASQDGHHRALIIAPAGAWGNTIVEAFKNRWQNSGGEIADQLSYQKPEQLSEQIRQILHVEKTSGRKSKQAALAKEEGKPLVRRRQDIDMIFLVAEPERARQIAPLLKFYYAGNVPVYATSLIYSGINNKDQDNDLNNIQFTDMPWVLGGLPDYLQNIQRNAAETWKNSYNHNPKLYALGVDAYYLSTNLNKLKSASSQGIQGSTGKLYLQDNQHILRELAWAKIHNGDLVSINPANTDITE